MPSILYYGKAQVGLPGVACSSKIPTIRLRDCFRGCAEGATRPARTARPAATNATSVSRLRIDSPHRRQHPAQSFLECDLRLPAEQLLRAGDVRLADLRIVHGQRFEHDLARRLGHADHGLRELENRELARVAEIHGQMLLARGKQIKAADQVVHVAEAPRLRSVAEHGQWFVLECLTYKRRDRAAVVGAHPRSVRV